MDPDKNRIPVLERAIEIVEYIASHPGRVTQPELIAALKIPQATCYRIVATLVAANYLSKSANKSYDIAPALARLGRKIDVSLEKYRPLQPALEHLARTVGFSVKFSVRDGSEHVNVLSAKAPWDVALTAAPGTRFPLAAPGSVAVILLAAQPEEALRKLLADAPRREVILERIAAFRRDGCSFYPASAEEGRKSGIDALSIPVTGRGGETAGVLTLLSMPGELEQADRAKLLPEMRKTADFCVAMLR